MRLVLAVAAATLLATAPAAAAAGFEVVGHRGARGLAPENTIPGFSAAVAAGATAVELDVVMSKDNHVIVRHDRRVSRRTCSGPYQGRLYRSLTLAQIRRLDCGSPRAEGDLAATMSPAPGAHVPSLGQIYRLLPHRVRVIVEIKRSPLKPHATPPRRRFARRVAQTIRAAHGLRRTTVQSFDWGVLREAGRLDPRLRLMGLANRKTAYRGSPWLGGVHVKRDPFRDGLTSAAKRAGFDALDVPYTEITADLVDGAHLRGLEILPYTVDDPGRMRELLALGVDGIISDYPDRLRHTARRAGTRIAR